MSKQDSRKELIVEVDAETGSTGQEGGLIFTRETGSGSSSSGMRYRSAGSLASTTESIRLDSPDIADGFVDVGVSNSMKLHVTHTCNLYQMYKYSYM